MVSNANSPEVLLSGLGLVESARWAHGYVWFSDWINGRIHRVEPGVPGGEVVAEVPSLPLCFDFIDDEIVVFDSRAEQLLRGRPGGELRRWIDVGGLARGGGNEILAVGDRLYLNFGNFVPQEGFPDAAVGILALVTADGGVDVVADTVDFPNGMAVTPDGHTLVVAESHAGRLAAWDILPDGSLTGRRPWAEVAGSAPDGISMAPDGTCWFADTSTRSVTRVAEGGAVLDRVDLDRGAFSCVVAPELETLYVTAAHWPGGQRMFDPSHEWDGQLLSVR